MSRTTRLFQEEVTFFVRTFFFVYVGLLMSIDYFQPVVVMVSLAIVALVLIGRYIFQKLLVNEGPLADQGTIVTMMPRGLAAVVVATLPTTSGIMITNFQEIVFTVILFTNVAATLGVFAYNQEPKEEDEKEKEEKKPEEEKKAVKKKNNKKKKKSS